MENPLEKALSGEVKAAARVLISSWESCDALEPRSGSGGGDGDGDERTSNPGEPASRPEKSAARIPAFSNCPEPIRLGLFVSLVYVVGGRVGSGSESRSGGVDDVVVPGVNVGWSWSQRVMKGIQREVVRDYFAKLQNVRPW